jgi:zinc transport system substrate-binding protein
VDPTPKQLVELTNVAKERNVKAIFNEPQLSDKAVNTIAKNLSLNVGVLDPLGSSERVFDLESLYLDNLFEIIRVVNYDY